YHGFSSIAIMK
ncbi:hypothetical protein SOVF_068710, partial [Spinacia oleracea]